MAPTATCRVLVCCLILLAAAPSVAQATSTPLSGDRLAYIAGGKLYVGPPGTTRLVPGPGNAFQPVFSFDGRWLAFLRQRWNGYDASSQLWLVRSDGSRAHAISAMGAAGVDSFQWSPTADVLAFQPTVAHGVAPLQLVPVQGRPQTLPGQLSGSFLWSPDGSVLAVATLTSGYSRLYTVMGTTVHSYLFPGVRRFDRVELAGWWPDRRAVLYWIDPMASASIAADGMQLLSLDLRTGRARHLGITLGYHDWVAASGNRLLVVKGGDRSAFFGKHLKVCRAFGPCIAIPSGGANHISVDPAWAPTGGWNSGAMAFVVAPAWKTMGFQSAARYRRWLDAHVLWTAQPNGRGAAPVEGVPKGAQDPEWTRDGRGILFVKDGILWGDSHVGAANAVRIVRLVPAHFVPDLRNPAYQDWYYGHMDWHDLFAWY